MDDIIFFYQFIKSGIEPNENIINREYILDVKLSNHSHQIYFNYLKKILIINIDYNDTEAYNISKIARIKYNYLLTYIISPYEFSEDLHVEIIHTNNIKMRIEKYESDKQIIILPKPKTLYSYLYSFFY